MDDTFDVEVEQREGVVLVRPTGPLASASTEVLRDIMGELSDRGSSAVLDLSGLTAIDGAGVRLVLEAYATSQRDGLGLTLLPGPPVVMRVFEMAGVLPELPFEPDADRGVAER